MTPTPLIQTAINGPRVSERFESAGLPKNREGVETIRSELQSLQEIMRKKPERACEIFENLQKQIAGRQEIPPSVFTRINEAKKNYDEGSFQLSEQLVADLERSISPEPMSEALIQEHTEKAAAYLVNTLDRNNSVLNITGNIPGYNPFYGDLNAPALIRYRRENEEKNYSAEYAQEALRGLPIYEEDETTPKIYSAVAPNGGET
ncbi:hypothetical protein HZA41_03610, partial [Candidatus Peregrinibacteria bacterium]|nr:hypothetical protein [Candidatus Peregrinibacteria bacterium]